MLCELNTKLIKERPMSIKIVPASASLRLHHELRVPLSKKLHHNNLGLSRYINALVRRDLQAEGLLSQEEQR